MNGKAFWEAVLAEMPDRVKRDKMEREAGLRIQAARAFLLSHETYTYLAPAILAVHPVPTGGPPGVALAADGRMFYDPAVVAEMPVAPLAGLILVEVLRFIRDHAGRARTLPDRTRTVVAVRTPAGTITVPLVSLASTMEIVDDLVSGLFADPAVARAVAPILPGPEALDLEPGQTFESYYRALYDRAQDAGGPTVSWGSASGAPAPEWEGDAEDGPHADGQDPADGGAGSDGNAGPFSDPAVAQAVRHQVLAGLHDAMRRRGMDPGDMGEFVDRILARPKRSPVHELRAAVRRSAVLTSGWGDVPTYTRPPRRMMPGPVLRPGRASAMPSVVVLVDTSGSMKHDDLAVALAVVVDVARGLGLPRVPVVMYDTARQAQVDLSANVRGAEFIGRGGTMINKALVELSDEAVRSVCRPAVVVITDGYTDWPGEPLPGLSNVVAVLTVGQMAYCVPDWIRVIVWEQ